MICKQPFSLNPKRLIILQPSNGSPVVFSGWMVGSVSKYDFFSGEDFDYEVIKTMRNNTKFCSISAWRSYAVKHNAIIYCG